MRKLRDFIFNILLIFMYQWLYSRLLGPGCFFSFVILYTVGRTPWTGDQSVTRPLLTHRYPCLKWDSNPRPQCSSGRRQFTPEPARPPWYFYTDGKFRRVCTGLLSCNVAGGRCGVTLVHTVDCLCNVVAWLLHTDTNWIICVSARPEDPSDSDPETYAASCTNWNCEQLSHIPSSRAKVSLTCEIWASQGHLLPSGIWRLCFRRQARLLTFRRNILPLFQGKIERVLSYEAVQFHRCISALRKDMLPPFTG
jgi:hypothetical protein